MKVVFKTDELKKVFTMIASCISEDKLHAIHNMFLKKIDDGSVYVRAMDNKHVFETCLTCVENDSFLQSYIPFFEINKFVYKFKNDKINFVFKENDVLRVSSGSSYCQVSLKNAEQSEAVLNMINSDFTNQIVLCKKVFQNIKSKMNGITAVDTNRPVLNGICLDVFENGIYFAASDGKKLAVYDTNVQFSNEFLKKIIIPIDVINSLCSVCDDEIKFCFNDKYLKVISGDKTYYSTLINGEYPDYRRILNSTNDNNIVVQVNKTSIVNALQFVNINFDVTKKCEIIIKENKFALNFNNNESFEQFEIESNESFSVFVNSQFLEKMIKPLQTEKIVFKFLNPAAPILIESDGFKLMLMPLKVR